MKLTEWNEGWETTSPAGDIYETTEVNGDYTIDYYSSYSEKHPRLPEGGSPFLYKLGVMRKVYFHDELIFTGVGMQSGYSAARREAYKHWKANN